MRMEISDRYLKPVVVALIVFFAGPEILAASEMLALLELLGAANFILLYVYGFKALIGPLVAASVKLVRRLEPSLLFIPSWSVTKRMPGLLVHAVPLHTLALVSMVFMSGRIAWHGIQLL